MNSKIYISRKKTEQESTRPKVICDTEELNEHIISWAKSEGHFFEEFVELIGIKTPIILSNLNKITHSFMCHTILNEHFEITLRFGCGFSSSKIIVNDENEKRTYDVYHISEKEQSVPKATLVNRNIKRNGKELNNDYNKDYCCRTLTFDSTHMLKVDIDSDLSKKTAEVENYLLSLNSSLVVSEVYDTFINLLGLSDNDISNCSRIKISYIEKFDDKDLVRSTISISKGNLQEYAVLENGETFHVYRNGIWSFLSDSNIRIIYNPKIDYYDFSVEGIESTIMSINLAELMTRVKKRIHELQEFVK